MPKKCTKPKVPSYRQREGHSQALVTLTDAATKKRRDYWFGEYGSPASRELYHRVIAEWEANGPNELLGLRGCDLEKDSESGIWLYRPEKHKNAFREKERVIYFGPKAQLVLQPFVEQRPTTSFLFSPANAEAARRAALHERRTTPRSCGNRPGTNRQPEPRKCPGDRYTSASYCRAIQYACQRAFPLPAPLARLPKETMKAWRERVKAKWDEIKEWRRTHRWFPYQLRHNAATLLRREFGLEAAQLTLGHASAQITDAVYAERDQVKVMDIMRRIG